MNYLSAQQFDGMTGSGVLPEGMSGVNAIQQELNKALTVGYPPSAPGTFGVNVYESLSPVMTVLTSTEKHLKFFKAIPKEGCNNTAVQYNQLLDYGDNADGSFIGEIDVPTSQQATYVRQIDKVRYMGEMGQVSIAATLVDSIEPAEEQEVTNCTARLLRNLERNLFYSDSSINPLRFDGYKARIIKESPRSNRVDMKGAPLTSAMLDYAIGTVTDGPNYGDPTHLFMNIKGLQAFNRSYNPQARLIVNNGSGTNDINFDFKTYTSSAGSVELVGSPFINQGSNAAISQFQNYALAPSAPTVSTAAAAGAPANGVTSKFVASDAGNYFYFVQAANKNGRSPLVQINQSALNVSSGQAVTFSITQGAGAAPDVFYIFRTPNGGLPGTQQEIAQVANVIGSSGPVAVQVTDANARMPGTTDAFLFQMDVGTLSWVQLLPLVRYNLARVDTSNRFMELLFGVPSFKAPGRFFLFENVGIGPVLN